MFTSVTGLNVNFLENRGFISEVSHQIFRQIDVCATHVTFIPSYVEALRVAFLLKISDQTFRLCRNHLFKPSCYSNIMIKTSGWHDALAETINHSVRAQIAFEIPRCNVIKFHRPLFGSAVIGIGILM